MEVTTMAGSKPSREEREKELGEILNRQGPEAIRRIYEKVIGEPPYMGAPMIREIIQKEYDTPAES
jgi:hypothetical protein